MRLLRAANLNGAVLITDVSTGTVVASAAIGRRVETPMLPLSVIKIYVAALWWDAGLGDGALAHPRKSERVTVHDVLVEGWDKPGEEMAITLRERSSGASVIAALAKYGINVTLAPDIDDKAWGNMLSIGERDCEVTLASVSAFLRKVGSEQRDTMLRLRAAMRDAVSRGTAKSAAAFVPRGWALGGKTGTGPFVRGTPYDGWFAGLIFEGDRPRYTVAVYIERGGLGGGIAARLAADLASFLAAR